jgi:hypothetical protein
MMGCIIILVLTYEMVPWWQAFFQEEAVEDSRPTSITDLVFGR